MVDRAAGCRDGPARQKRSHQGWIGPLWSKHQEANYQCHGQQQKLRPRPSDPGGQTALGAERMAGVSSTRGREPERHSSRGLRTMPACSSQISAPDRPHLMPAPQGTLPRVTPRGGRGPPSGLVCRDAERADGPSGLELRGEVRPRNTQGTAMPARGPLTGIKWAG